MTQRIFVVVLLAVSLFTLGAVHAQSKLECYENTLFQIGDRTLWDSAIHEPVAIAVLNFPARFPNPASKKEIEESFVMKCPSFTARRVKDTFTITGNVQQNLGRLINYWFEGNPDQLQKKQGRINLLFSGDFRFPDAREGWSQRRVYMELANGKLVVSYETSLARFKNQVVAVRINGGALKPVVFDSKITQIRYGSSDLLEFYISGSDASFDYMALNFKRGIITVQNGVKFPSK